ncbi:hypothetical protein Hbl1158_10775 [Halobaculum sp. CBA1158]|uniref:hypothetical protein n=1 Tax=Halobaculum sp. CBA1158 TaxID=2904243 RepID=UPI001F419E91|nr:hypothetical protein [Halobaculum sp. CBA1158]UIO99015.1 hypothetical protein Hbl1158_10775 [Halobaculum sp. CBA1158]
MSLFERVAAAFREPDADGSEEPPGDGGVTDPAGGGDDADPADDGDEEHADEEHADEATDAVVAVCQRAPDGIRTYTVEVVAEGAEIAEVAPGLLEAHFEVVEGGVGEDRVTVRAVDFRGEARSVEAETLVGVRFAEPVPRSEVRMRLVAGEDHDGDTLPSESFRLASVE